MESTVIEILCEHAAPCVAAIGTFDGVHRGHRAVIVRARETADRLGVGVTAVSFFPRPETVFRSTGTLPDIHEIEERRRLLHEAGADRVVVLPFTLDLARVEDDAFLEALREHLGMRAVCVGEDFSLGRGRRGTPQRIRELGYDVHVVDLVPSHGEDRKASSSAIRMAIAEGVSPEEALDGE